MKTITYTITDALGLHARPAGILVKNAGGYASKITIKNQENGKEADAKRIIGVMALGVKCGNTIELTVDGSDEEKAAAELQAFLKENL